MFYKLTLLYTFRLFFQEPCENWDQIFTFFPVLRTVGSENSIGKPHFFPDVIFNRDFSKDFFRLKVLQGIVREVTSQKKREKFVWNLSKLHAIYK